MEKPKLMEETSGLLLEHYRKTGRTPLLSIMYVHYSMHEVKEMRVTWSKKYDRFIELVNETEGAERKELIKKGIFQFKRLIMRNTDPEVIDYFEEFILELENLNHQKDYSKLFHELINEKYIKDCSLYDFNYVMNYQILPGGKDKIIWLSIRKHSDVFRKSFDFSLPDFNKCFVHKDGTTFRSNDNNGKLHKEFEDIIIKYVTIKE